MTGGIVMKPKTFLTVCIIVMAASVAVMAYDYFVASPSALETYVVSNWTFGAAMLARPALLAAAGALMSGILTFSSDGTERYGKIWRIIGIVILGIYLIIAICLMAGVRGDFLNEIGYFVMKFPYAFILPGALAGVGAVKRR